VAALLLIAGTAVAAEHDFRAIVLLHVIKREALFFSGRTGTWTAVRLDSGEQVVRSGADGAVAVVLTSRRAIGFSALLGRVDEVPVPQEEGLEAFRVSGEVASVLTRRRALGFSAQAGRWAEVERFQLGAGP
jgi:hypothetical protein